jgi:hypothetical protein
MSAIPNNIANRQKDENFYAQQDLPGVKYVKISRYDANGVDNYTSLRELDNIRLVYSNGLIADYPIVAITEYSNYFLYQIVTTNVTSSTNNQILNYRVEAQDTVAFTFDPSTGAEFYFIDDYDIETFNSLNYLNTANGKYILGNTPNIPIIITASADWNNNLLASPAATNPIISLRKIIGPTTDFTQIILQKSSSAAALSGTVTLSGSFFPIEGETYGIYVSDTSLSNPTRFTGITLILTQSATPLAGIGSLTVLEPYITTPFINSDYDSLINNAYVNRTSTVYMDVDYSDSNQVTPVNLRTILSSSAVPAPVQDSNYTTQRVISSRYEGKQLESLEFNKYTEGDISYGKTPNVSNPQTYFTQFNWLAGTLPEWGTFGGESKIYSSTKYITDENGNNIKPISDSEGVNLSIIRQTFEEGKNATVQLSNPQAFETDMSSLNGTFPIFKSGKKIKPIIYTQVAQYDDNGDVSGYTYTGSINFIDGDVPNNISGNTSNDYRLMTFVPSLGTNNPEPNRITGTSLEIKFNSPILLGLSASFATSSTSPVTGSRYKPTGSLGALANSGYYLILESYLKFNSTINDLNIAKIFLNIQKSTDGGSNWNNLENLLNLNPLFSDSLTFTNSVSGRINLKYIDNNPTTSSLYRVAVTSIENKYYLNSRRLNNNNVFATYNYIPTEAGFVQVADGSYFKVTQYPSPSTGNVTNFWMTGSVSNYLYAKRGTGGNVGLNDIFGQKQQNIENSGFDSITLDFEPQINDEIRFMGTELEAYKITQITQSITSSGAGNYNALTLILDRNLTRNINTDYFLLRRYVDDVGTIILSTTKPAGGTSTGIMKPEYVTSQTENAVDSVISSFESQ